MIGTHDSLTYLKSNFFNELFSFVWRCQKKTLDEQYAENVRFFDIRITLKNKHWTFCHDKATLKDFSFLSIDNLCKYFSEKYPDAYFRIILERGNEKVKKSFIDEITGLEHIYPALIWYGIKKPWTTLWFDENIIKEIKEYNCCLFNWHVDKSFFHNIRHLNLGQTIKRYAEKNNPKITKKMISSKHILHLFDYV